MGNLCKFVSFLRSTGTMFQILVAFSRNPSPVSLSWWDVGLDTRTVQCLDLDTISLPATNFGFLVCIILCIAVKIDTAVIWLTDSMPVLATRTPGTSNVLQEPPFLTPYS